MSDWFVRGVWAHRERNCPEIADVADEDLRAVVEEAILAKVPYQRCERCRWPDPPTLD